MPTLSNRPNQYGLPYYRTNPDKGWRCTKSNKRVTKLQRTELNFDNHDAMGVCPECGKICRALWGVVILDNYTWEPHFRKGEEPIEQRETEPRAVEINSENFGKSADKPGF